MATGLSGLASGVDTSTVVDQLMALERQPLVKKERQQRLAESRQAALRDIATRMRNLKVAGADLRSAALWAPKQAVESSDATKTSARWTAGAGAGSYELDVTQLARAEQRTFAYTAGAADSTLTVNGRDYAVTAGATTQSVVDQVNNDSASTVFASKVGEKIVLSSKETGAAYTITAASTAPGAEWSEDVTKQRVGLDAGYSIDGVLQAPSAKNVVTDAIVGVELTFKTKGVTTVSVGGPSVDKDQVKAKVRAFVEQYNSTVDFVRSKLTEKKVVTPETDADRLKGMLKSDPLLSAVVGRLRSTMTETLAGNPAAMDQLIELGISTGASSAAGTVSADALAGKLVLDETKLDQALTGDLASAKRLLAGDGVVAGLGQRIEDLVKPNTDTGGALDERIKTLDGEVSRIRGAMADIDRRLASKEKRLRAQFATMERALAASQTQQATLASQLASLRF
jgi:flagellar hook-associated protein 2